MYSTYSDCVMRVRPTVENNNGSEYLCTFTKFEGGKSCVTSPFLSRLTSARSRGRCSPPGTTASPTRRQLTTRSQPSSSGSGRGYRSLFSHRDQAEDIDHCSLFSHRDQADDIDHCSSSSGSGKSLCIQS